MKPIIVTLAWLNANNACTEQVELFTKTFGKRAVITPEIASKVAHKFDIDWFAERVLDEHSYNEFCNADLSVRETYHRADRELRMKFTHKKDGDPRVHPQWGKYGKALSRVWSNRIKAGRKARLAFLFTAKRRTSSRGEYNTPIY